MTPCAACPCDDPGRCPGTGNAHLCGIAARGTAAGLDHVRGLAGEPPRGLPGAPPLPLAESIRRVAAINACPDRTPTPGCGCSGTATCARDGQVKTRDACWSCVATA